MDDRRLATGWERDDVKTKWKLFELGQLPGTWWESWDRLNDQHASSHPLLSSHMVRALVRHFPGAGMRFAEWSDGATPRIQTIVQPAGRGRWAVFAPPQAPIAPLVFARSLANTSPGVLRRMMAAMPRALALGIPYQDPEFTLAPTTKSGAYTHQSLGTTIAVVAPDGFDAYWNARPRDLRQNMRRYTKRIERDGLVLTLRTITDSRLIGDAVDRFGEVESLGWKGKEGTALHPANAQGRFYRDLLSGFATLGRATAFELWFGEQLAASRLLISSSSMYVMLKTTYLEEFRQYAPGRILLHQSLQHLLSGDGTRRIEFYTRANTDMLAWSTESREMYSLTYYRFPLIAAVAKWRSRAAAADAAGADQR